MAFQMTPDSIPGFNIALDVVTVIATLVGFLVIFLSMYTAILERTREIGILKSMGASKTTIVSMVLRESILMAIVGVALGIGLIYAIHGYLDARYPTLFFEITGQWIVRASIIAFLGTIFGAAYPALMAARKDPIDALSTSSRLYRQHKGQRNRTGLFAALSFPLIQPYCRRIPEPDSPGIRSSHARAYPAVRHRAAAHESGSLPSLRPHP